MPLGEPPPESERPAGVGPSPKPQTLKPEGRFGLAQVYGPSPRLCDRGETLPPLTLHRLFSTMSANLGSTTSATIPTTFPTSTDQLLCGNLSYFSGTPLCSRPAGQNSSALGVRAFEFGFEGVWASRGTGECIWAGPEALAERPKGLSCFKLKDCDL